MADPLEPFINDDDKAHNGSYGPLVVAGIFALTVVAILIGHFL